MLLFTWMTLQPNFSLITVKIAGQRPSTNVMEASKPKFETERTKRFRVGELSESDAGTISNVGAAADRYHAMNIVFFLEAAMHGRYPKAFVGEPPYELMGFKAGDEKLLYAPLDRVGFHYYARRIVSEASRKKFLGGGGNFVSVWS